MVNGFYINGQEQYNNAIFIVDSADHTGAEIWWCDIFDFQGIAVDLYDDDTDTDAIINNCKIYENGNGVKLSYGGNTIDENLIYNNTIYGTWSDYTVQIFTHNDFYGNAYGLYLESNSSGITYRDNISHQNSLYGIYSEIGLVVTYCNITDATYNISSPTGAGATFTDNPLFIDTTVGSENFNLKTIELGYTITSPCSDSSSTGIDIGAYDVDAAIDEDAWKKYDLEFNPAVEWLNIPKGEVDFTDAKGFRDTWAKAHRRGFIFSFNAPQVSSQELRNKLEHFSTLVRKRENSTVDEETKFRIHFQPTTFLETGTGTIDASETTITDATQSWTENQWKGYHVGVRWTAGVGTGTIAAVAKTLTVAPNPAWTNDEWIGFYVYYNGYYYYIQDNTNNVLTLSDPLGTLTNDANINWNIEKYHKISSNNENVLCVCDGDGELPDGEYYYYIDFIVCKVNRIDFGYSQPRYAYTREHTKTGYSISFEECKDSKCD
jgi:hypothetical protein